MIETHLDTSQVFVKLVPLRAQNWIVTARETMFKMILLVLVKRHPRVDGIFKLLLYRWC